MRAVVAAVLVVISIDGLRPDYVLEADRYGLKIPNLRRLLAEGAHASGVAGVLPTVTYPSHTTLVTGVWPARHGILANTTFDPQGKNHQGWYWYAEDIRVPTLWDEATRRGLVSSNVDWPVTVGAHITYNIPQIWRASTDDDAKLSRALSTPGLLAEAERAVGPYPSGDANSVDDDARRSAFCVFLLETKRPQLHFCYLTGFDEEQHDHGPGSPQALAGLERIDGMVGDVRAAAEKAGGGQAVVAIVSDHGFLASEHEVHLNAALNQAGLIQVDAAGAVASWQAFAWLSGGTAGIMLRDPADAATRSKTAEVLRALAADETSGVEAVLTGDDLVRAGGFPGAAFVVAVRPGYRLGPRLDLPVTREASPRGMHGSLREHHEMDASFLIAGPHVPAGADLGRIDMRDIAPTLAARLGLRLSAAEGHDVLAPWRSGATPASAAHP
jgi:predicted AlkP superfamily pyrophosphatase or phosphodiesterase